MTMQARPRVVVAGSANMDLIATAPNLPRPGETVLGRDFAMVPGGKGGNQAIAASRAGAECTFLGAIGSDSFGVTLRARLTASGVDTSLVRTVYGASGVAVIMVDAAGENSIVATPGANATFTGLTEREFAAIAAADVLVCQLEVPVETVTAAAVAARAAGTRVVVNAAPARPLPDELLGAVDLLVVNEVEAVALTGRGREDRAAPMGGVVGGGMALLASVPRAVLTLGADGAWYGDREGTGSLVPAPLITAVDSTAAGDAFTGALAVAWGEDRPILDAVRWACAAGAACARRPGAYHALPVRAEIEELYAATYGG
jgi:ribokinase